MSIRDSLYTSPDALRAKYRNPRNALGGVEEAASNNIGTTQAVETPTAPTNNNYYAPSQYGCPASTEWILTVKNRQFLPKQAKDIVPFEDYLFNPLTRRFQKVIKSRLIKDVRCVSVITNEKAETICSYSHPIIRDFFDADGMEIGEMLARQIKRLTAVTWKPDVIDEAKIFWVNDAGRRDVVWISLENNGIYASGTDGEHFVICHNKPANGGQSELDIDNQIV